MIIFFYPTQTLCTLNRINSKPAFTFLVKDYAGIQVDLFPANFGVGVIGHIKRIPDWGY
jgi:hypothetical protein